VAFHAPGAREAEFIPLLLLDAVLTGAKGVNLWSSFRVPPPQRGARLYRALVDTGLASSISGSVLPTEQPFLYTVSATATVGTSLGSVESALLAELERVRQHGITPQELVSAKAQLNARLVFDDDSITNIAHQLGYFETVASADVFTSLRSHVQSVTAEDVSRAARDLLRESNRTIGWFDPLPVSGSTPGGQPAQA
jgi:zinc protease